MKTRRNFLKLVLSSVAVVGASIFTPSITKLKIEEENIDSLVYFHYIELSVDNENIELRVDNEVIHRKDKCKKSTIKAIIKYCKLSEDEISALDKDCSTTLKDKKVFSFVIPADCVVVK